MWNLFEVEKFGMKKTSAKIVDTLKCFTFEDSKKFENFWQTCSLSLSLTLNMENVLLREQKGV